MYICMWLVILIDEVWIMIRFVNILQNKVLVNGFDY